MNEDEIFDDLVGMGVGQTQRYGSVKVFHDRDSWLVAAAGTTKEFGNARWAARWIALLLEDDAGF